MGVEGSVWGVPAVIPGVPGSVWPPVASGHPKMAAVGGNRGPLRG